MATLKEWAKAEHGRVGMIAKCLDITPQYASMIVNGKHKLTTENTLKLKKLTSLSVAELNPELAEVMSD